MAFSKMEGFEVTPTTPSSIILCSAPPSMRSSREMESIQIPCPNPAAFLRFSFTVFTFLCGGREDSAPPVPTVLLRPTMLPFVPTLRVPLRWICVLYRGCARLLTYPFGATEQIQRLVRDVLGADAELLQQLLARHGGPVAVDADAPAAKADITLPAGGCPRLDRDARLDRWWQHGVLVRLVLRVEDLPRRYADH